MPSQEAFDQGISSECAASPYEANKRDTFGKNPTLAVLKMCKN